MNSHLQRVTVEIEVNAACQPRAMISQHHVGPAIQLNRPLRLHARPIIQPALNQVRLKVSIFEIRAEALAFGLIRCAADNGARRGRGEYPCNQSERIIRAEIRDVSDFDVRLRSNPAARAE